jgi:hypothetical protein
MIVSAAQLYGVADGKFATGAPKRRDPVAGSLASQIDTLLWKQAPLVRFSRTRDLAGERELDRRVNPECKTTPLVDAEQARVVCKRIESIMDL